MTRELETILGNTDPQPIVAQGSDGTNLQILKTDANGNSIAVGPAADDAAASGNPVPVGGIFNTTRPTYTSGDRTQVQTDARGAQAVFLSNEGSVVSANVAGAADNATIATAGLRTVSVPMLSDGTTLDVARSAQGAALVNTGIGVTAVEEGGRTYSHITAAAPTTTVVKSGAGHLHTLVINTPAANAVITIYDNTAASGTVIAIITQPAALLSSGPTTVVYDIAFTTGLTIHTATAAQDITVSYR